MRVWLWFIASAGDAKRWFSRRGRMPLLLASVVMIGGGVWIMTAASGAIPQIHLPGWSASPPLSEEEQREDQAAFRWMLEGNPGWAEGDQPLMREQIEFTHEKGWGDTHTVDYWIIFRGTKETGSHVDKNGNPVTVRCLHLYAKRAEQDSGAYIAPHPYFLGFLVWPEVRARCARDWGPLTRFVPRA